MKGKYDDIINLSRPRSVRFPPMPIANRAAQFAPFAALADHKGAILETARHTEKRPELSESALALLDRKLMVLEQSDVDRPEVRITYFAADPTKPGGQYLTIKGRLHKIDAYAQALILSDGQSIAIADIIDIESPELPDLL